MKFYEIDQQLREILEAVIIDEETGEIIDGFDSEKFEQLTLERDKKLEGIGVYIKELNAEADALKTEYKALKDRADRKLKKADNLKNFVSDYLITHNIPKFESPKAAFSFRKSEVVDADEAKVPKKYFNKKVEFVLDKMGIKKLLKSGTKIKGCQLIEKQNLQIK